ncbi:hypothetical protein [Arthrobacter cavernae]|uniref:Uncharacterized protein n=1 Tax=Arthrobacter cavernae TaxID=2817681 RepID=A0A939HLR3_9MICC|nr:hypothetical protein [Arthrobacter cavernae]MBO1269603.1 hypothetical protein [Arthrobacter cavernae]
MNTSPSSAGDPNYDIYTIDFLNDPAAAGLGPEFAGMGLLRISVEGSGQHATALVEHDYAVTALTARRDLEGFIALSATAVRWLRLGWPEEWGTPELPPTWAPAYPAGGHA